MTNANTVPTACDRTDCKEGYNDFVAIVPELADQLAALCDRCEGCIFLTPMAERVAERVLERLQGVFDEPDEGSDK